MSTVKRNTSVISFTGAEELLEEAGTISGFEVYGFSSRSPAKSGDNEDSAVAMAYGEKGLVLAVADGAGGLPAGRKASNTVIETLASALPEAAAAGTPMRIAIMSAIEESNRRILDYSNGSATTLTVLGIEDGEVRHYQVGDSVALLIGQRGKLKTQTMPHSPVGFAVEAGLLDEEEAMMHADRHYVSNFVGLPYMRIDVGPPVPISPRDTVVVASDGLTDNLHLAEIIEMVRKGPLTDCLDDLAEACLLRMNGPEEGQPSKPDDLTILIGRRLRGSGK